jgi:hypothetical protein
LRSDLSCLCSRARCYACLDNFSARCVAGGVIGSFGFGVSVWH